MRCQFSPLSESLVVFTLQSVTAGCTQEVQNIHRFRVDPASLINSFPIVITLLQIELEELQYSINWEIFLNLPYNKICLQM